ncbi:hypothetical protein [Duganella callida]|uniref:Uncharacterized protein n=1 Tax=Duganella callida TaxID=2561932 RepID=A0A4Y9S8P9_9BURK|nr:hypothetical protein [Duganella callida]TFW15916.1 hypothetical protein E4L98_24775 [Duganella callida]
MTHECTEARFLRDVDDHKMIVIRDEGANRHVRFKQPNSSNMYFDLITWPGYLCYTGDMGTYVFQRTEDMFAFFRTDRLHQRPGDARLAVNRSYWGEKLEAIGKNDGYREFSSDKFKQQVMQYVERCGLTGKLGHGLREELESEVLAHADDGADEAYRAVRDFVWDGRAVFNDFWEVDCEEYTFRFLWCCYALAWGIEQYDKVKQAAEAVPAETPP